MVLVETVTVCPATQTTDRFLADRCKSTSSNYQMSYLETYNEGR